MSVWSVQRQQQVTRPTATLRQVKTALVLERSRPPPYAPCPDQRPHGAIITSTTNTNTSSDMVARGGGTKPVNRAVSLRQLDLSQRQI